jgi:hypothetical protein
VTARSIRSGAVTQASYVIAPPQSWPTNSTARPGDQRSISEHVAGQGCEIERPRGRGRRVTAKPRCDDVTSAVAELGKEGLGGWRMVREAVQDERRLTIGVTTPQRVKGAVWQVEGDVFELHVCQASPRAVGWGSKPEGRPSPRPPATA